MRRPESSEYPEYYRSYIDYVKGDDILKSLKDQVLEVQTMIARIPEEKEGYAYSTGKWTIKEVVGHIIDTERVLAYRAMRFSRKDKTILAGFDENLFVENGNFNEQSLFSLGVEFGLVRSSNIALFKNFNEEALNQIGNANGVDVSVRSILYMMAGHVIHHSNVIKSKYLID